MGLIKKWLAYPSGLLVLILLGEPHQAIAQAPWQVTPKGVMLLELGSSQERQTEAVDSAGIKKSLSQYLDYQDEIKGQLNGNLERNFTRNYLYLQYGLKDTLNLRLELNRGTAKQTGSAVPSAVLISQTPSPQLQSQDLSGSGNHTLMLVFRNLLVEGRSLQWRLGYSPAVNPKDFPYSNPYSLSPGSYSRSLLLGVQNTIYPASSKSRLDMQLASRYHLKTPLTTTENQNIIFQQGHQITGLLHWQSLLDPLILSLGLQAHYQGSTKEDNQKYDDNKRLLNQILGLAIGNLHQLEQGQKPTLPWQLELKYTNTAHARNSPLTSETSLSLLAYF